MEAVETAIWLTEVAPKSVSGKRILSLLASVNKEANPDLMRLALKLATGAGKTTVMAMLIAWQTSKAVRSPGSKTFTRGFLIVAPVLTIKDRLQVLQPNDPNSYYKDRELVPNDMLDEVNRAKIVITNYHAFKLRERIEISKGGRQLLREVMNTVGKAGQLGAGIRCVVSVSMLTEGWDANNVTHVRFNTSKTDRWDTQGPPPKCHLNWVILDSDWEAEFCRVAESHAQRLGRRGRSSPAHPSRARRAGDRGRCCAGIPTAVLRRIGRKPPERPLLRRRHRPAHLPAAVFLEIPRRRYPRPFPQPPHQLPHVPPDPPVSRPPARP